MKENYLRMLHVMAVIIAIGMWVLSIKFSVDGFDMDSMEWAGLMLGLFVTGIELIWNKAGVSGGFKNLTLFSVGLLSYVYGIYTNVVGIMLAQGISKATLQGDPFQITFPIILGLFLEITPEVLLVWGLIGSAEGGDFLSNIFGFSQPITPEKRNGQPQKPQQAPQPQRNQQVYLDGRRGNGRGGQPQPQPQHQRGGNNRHGNDNQQPPFDNLDF